MRAFLALGAFSGAYWTVDSMPTALAIPVGLIAIAGLFAGAVALAVKWVRNV
jgi:hypothetical protein